MKSPRRRSREFALQAIYQWLLAQHSTHEIEQQYKTAEGFDKADAALFKTLIVGVVQNAEALSMAMTPHLDRPWAEVSPVEKAVLLIAGFELIHMPETPYRVIINEAIELAKSFGGTDGHKYVNGVLDKLAAINRAEEMAAPAPIKRAAKPPAAKRR
ncbi:MAG: transcription antitermination factor NusB [Aeromicrobium sp.]|nr:transcription antitermination factor NusB [Burkholderiales bacterium]